MKDPAAARVAPDRPGAEPAPDPARVAEGWEPRFVTDALRAGELARLYADLGFETAVDPVRAPDVRPDCGECPMITLGVLHWIYTRAPRPSGNGAPPGGSP